MTSEPEQVVMVLQLSLTMLQPCDRVINDKNRAIYKDMDEVVFITSRQFSIVKTC